MYGSVMEVAVSKLRADLAAWVARARAGEDVLVTDRGTPVARLVPVDSGPLLERLVRDGRLSKPASARRPPAIGHRRAHADGPVADLVSDQRR